MVHRAGYCFKQNLHDYGRDFQEKKIRGGHKGYVTQLTATSENENDEAALESLRTSWRKKEHLKQLDDKILELVSKEEADTQPKSIMPENSCKLVKPVL